MAELSFTREQALDELRGNHYSLIKTERWLRAVAAPFGIEPPLYEMSDGEGAGKHLITLNEDGATVLSCGLWELSSAIARAMGASAEPAHGRGTRHRRNCAAIAEALQELTG